MFETHSINQNSYWKSKAVWRIINLGTHLDLFISGSCKDTSFLDFLVNKILDYSIDTISRQNTYKDFSWVLEHVNTVLKTWEQEESTWKMNMIIGLLNEKEFLFSNIWKSSCYLVKSKNIVEITDKRDKKKEFSFISNGTLEHNDIVVMSSKRLLNFFSESDFIDSYNKNITPFGKSLQLILDEEKVEKNISIISLIYQDKHSIQPNKKLDIAKWFAYKILDTNFVKRLIALFLVAKEKLSQKWQLVKMILFSLWIIISISLLFSIVWRTLTTNIQTEDTKIYSHYLKQAKQWVRKASENTSSKDIFNLNIKKTEELIEKIEKKGLFWWDLIKLREDISRIKKSVNGIESFSSDPSKKLISIKQEDTVSIIGVNKKIYLIGKKSISWPIIAWKELQKHTFKELWEDYFVDAITVQWEISLVTNNGKVVIFSKNGDFRFSDVVWQDSWEESNMISSYNSNIYLISKKENQIYKHLKSGKSFSKGIPYLQKKDQNIIGGMLDIAIDWGFYILKKDLSFVKFFYRPYRLEKLALNNLPDDYEISKWSDTPKIQTRKELLYVYMLLNNRILIFKPNTTRYQHTKNLTFIWQIEGEKDKIIDFYVKHDWEILILNTSGIYQMKYEIWKENKLLLR